MLGLEFYQIVWLVVVLIVEFILIYGTVHQIANPDIRDSHEAKRFNERVKYATSAMNTLAVGMVAGAVVVPLINGQTIGLVSAVWALAGIALHIIGQLALGLLRKEDGYE